MPTQIQRYYPRLSTIVTAEEIPEVLGFVKDGVVFLLSKIHYKDLQFSKSPRGDAAFYSLSIVSSELPKVPSSSSLFRTGTRSRSSNRNSY